MIKLQDTVNAPRGTIEYIIYKDGIAIEHTIDHNLVTNSGRNMLAKLVAGESTASPIAYIGFGTGLAPEALTDIQLENQLLIEVDNYVVSGEQVTFFWTLRADQGNDLNISEFGLFSHNGTMITHQVRGKVVGKASDMVIQGKYILHF